MLKHFAANKKRRLSALPNVGPYIYTTLKFLALRAPYIYIYIYIYIKLSRYRPEQAQRVDRGIALLFLDSGARRWWVVSTTPRPLYPREIPGTHCTGG
jgi:hypothetical protein